MMLLRHVFGLDDPNSVGYLWWSGVGTNVGLLGAAWVWWHKHNCHTPACLRIGKHLVGGTPYCNRHAEAQK